ncbi:MAG: DUF3891 family protein [Vicinamibacterales bacterium]
MIVRPAEDALHLITQPDHAALARRIMERWAPLHGANRRASILEAVEQHDNGWREPDAEPLRNPDTGRAFDFIGLPIPLRQAVWPRGVSRLAQSDPWAAALVAHHAATVYDRYRGDGAWAAFFPEMEAARDRLVEASGHSHDDLRHDYRFLRLGDLASLAFCTQAADTLTFDEWSFRLDGDRLVVTPDPFDGRDLPIAVHARKLPDASFESDATFRAAWLAAPAVTVRAVASGAR